MVENKSGMPERITGSVLGYFERPLLIRLARGMPSWVTPDRLTALGFFGAIMTFAGYGLCNHSRQFLWLASCGLGINWFGDSLDGTLARVRLIERPRYGFLVDHVTDLGSQLLIGLGAGLSPFVRLDVVCIALIAFLSFAVFSFMTALDSEKLQISYGGVGPTEVRCTLIAFNTLLVWYSPHSVVTPWITLSTVDLMILFLSICAFIVLGFFALRLIRRVAHDEG